MIGYIFRKSKGRGTVDTRRAPAWWLSRANEAEDFLRSLKGVDVVEIGRSAGGRPILCAVYGPPREDLPGRTSNSLSSAISGRDIRAFYGKGRRKRQSLLFLGNAHGVEFEGTVAALNMLNVIATGKDLRGRRWPRLQQAGRNLRLTIIPHFNIDGRIRFAEHKHRLNLTGDDASLLCQGKWRNGKLVGFPTAHLYFPIDVSKTAVLGGYFNDNGVNLPNDTDLCGDPQPETLALVSLLRAERPDCVLLSHTDPGSLVQPPDSFIPQRYRIRQTQIAALVGAACRARGFPKGGLVEAQYGYAREALYQSDLMYHACGALPLMVEFPRGADNCPDTFDTLLDIGMTMLEEIVVFGATFGFHPEE